MNEFFSFLLSAIEKEKADALLISGDIFDSASPSSASEKAYYGFLLEAVRTRLKDIVIIAGNHDSPSKLAAPSELLRKLRIHVVSSLSDAEPIEMEDAVVLPIPFPRDQEVRRFVQGETMEEGEDRMKRGIEGIYRSHASLLSDRYPVIAMGHLMASNAISDEEGIKDLYIGGLGAVDASVFSLFDYTALGHIHKPQSLNEKGTVRYSGSPIPMSFKEAMHGKSMVLVDVEEGRTEAREIPIPVFRNLITARGSSDEIISRLESLKKDGTPGWVSILIDEPLARETIERKARDIEKESPFEILSIKNLTIGTRIAKEEEALVELSSLTADDILENLMEERGIADDRRKRLKRCFEETKRRLEDEDSLN